MQLQRSGAVSSEMLLLKKTRDLTEMTMACPHGPGFLTHEAKRAEVMEVYGTTMLEASEECVFVLRDKEGQIVGEKRIPGY